MNAILLLIAVIPSPMRVVADIPLPGVRGRIDHMAYDEAHQRLFVAALGNDSLEVVDMRAGKRVRSIPGFSEPQGVAFVPGLDRIVVANGANGRCDVLDGKTLSRIGKVDAGSDADNVRYDAATKHVLVGFGDGAIGELDPKRMSMLRTAPFPGHPESFQIDGTCKEIYVNVPGEHEVVAIRRDTFALSAHWKISAASSNFPMALDEKAGKLYIGCRSPARLLRIDVALGRVDASVACDADADDVFLAGPKVVVTCGGGAVDTFDKACHPLGQLKTKPGARTGYLTSNPQRLVVAYPARDGHQAGLLVIDLGT